ncbi:lamin tail domain-containing protein [Kibdelosporangium aridum]|uniref:Lamin tail domain-containing protein n=1 Tax=Kibdelosporangium aridum TaxID=2030 RepID=A0A428Y8E1_KIBAR|nr:lamin tail domain-containing protein [Kibdelosporangium aridum]RSM63873.1 lamin tail domain-containing protein [Kibdelosporangium aridum]
MKRILSALAAATSIAALTVGAAGTATAAERAAQQVPSNIYISEVATRGAGPAGATQEYIEIATRGFREVNIGGLQLQAMFGQQLVTIPIPMGVVLRPNEVYTIAHARFTGCVPNQVFYENLPGTRTLQLKLGTPEGARVDAVVVPPHPPLLSLHRIAFTGTPTDFAPGPRTPCIADMTPSPAR